PQLCWAGSGCYDTSLETNKTGLLFDITLQIASFFDHTTIDQLASFISRKAGRDQDHNFGLTSDIMPTKAAYAPIKLAESKSNYPLSNAQRRLWVLSQFDEVSVAYNMSFVYELEKGIDIARLKNALYAIVDRHEVLRTVFEEDEQGEVRQWIRARTEIGFEIEEIDLSNETNPEQLLQEYDARETREPMDLSSKLIRASLLMTSATKTFLYFKVHHIISDEWSMQVLIRDVMHQYAIENSSLPQLPIQYKDYAEWQLHQLEQGAFDTHRDYWMQKLAGPLPLFSLSSRRVRPVVKTSHGAAMTSFIGTSATAHLKQFAKAHDGTLFMAVLATLKVLLYRFSGQDDLIIGSPVAGRSHVELEDQIGFYANTLVLRNSIDPAQSFESLFDTIRESTLEAYKHQVYPFDRLVEELELPHDTSRSAVFDVMLTLQDRSATGMSETVDEAEIDTIKHSGARASKFDLAFSVAEIGEYLTFNVEYNTDLYDSALIEQLIRSYQLLLERLFKDTTQAVGRIPMVSEKEKTKLLQTFNQTETAYPNQTILDLFAEQVRVRGNSLALQFGDTKLNYAQLDLLSNRMANYLKAQHGVQQGEIVAIQLKRSNNLVAAILAVLKLGAAYVPIEMGDPTKRVSFILEDSNSALCIDNTLIEAFELEMMNFDEGRIAESPKPEDLAYMIYTSGTTGNPKGVMISHSALHNYIQYAGPTYMEGRPLRFALFTSIAFDLTVTTLFTPLCHGGSITILPSFEHEVEVLDWIRNEDFDVAKLTPSHLEVLLDRMMDEEQPYTGTTAKTFIVGGEAFNRDSVQKVFDFYGINARIWNEYGPTECTVGCISALLENTEKPVVPIGRPTPNVKAYVLDDYLNLVPAGVPGELYLAGAQLANGYRNRPELNDVSFVSNPMDEGNLMYKTGDLVRWDHDGTMDYLGRKDEQVKIRGHRVELAEIAVALNNLPGVQQAVVDLQQREAGTTLVAYYVAENELDGEAISTGLGATLPDYMIPGFFRRIERIPLTANGKVDKRALPVIDALDEWQSTFIPPASHMEYRLTEIWKEVLGLEKIGVTNNFFELGGHSLKAMQLIRRYSEAFGVRIKIRDLFIHTTIRAQAIWLAQTTEEGSESIPLVKEAADYPLSDAQRQLWIASQFEDGSVAYNMPAHIRLNEAINLDLFERAIYLVVERHEVLRTRFLERETGEIRQEVSPMGSFDFKVEKINYSGKEEASALAMTYIEHDKYQAFDLAHGPLLRVAILTISEAEHICYYNLHHIVGDGWSMDVISRDLLAQYQLLESDPDAILSPLKIQFKDYASWLATNKSEHLAESRAYWNHLFAGSIPKLTLNLANERPALKSHTGGIFRGELRDPLLGDLQKLVKDSGTSLYMNLLSLVGMVLYHRSFQNRMIIGSPVAGRVHKDLHDQVGCYMNTVALLLELQEKNTYSETLGQVKEQVLAAHEHQMYPFDALVEDLDIVKDLTRSPLFDVMVVMNDSVNNFDNGDDQNSERLGFGEQAVKSKYDLTFYFTSSRGKVDCSIVYNADLFEKAAVKQLWNDLLLMAEAVVANIHQTIESYGEQIRDDAERDEQHLFSEGLTTSINEDF
ncbi:MAG: amino acid adenylation domain-containing protein, partial [Bacteroidota bacterium]